VSKHEGKLAQKSPAKRAITNDSGALDDKDIETATGGLTFHYGRIEFRYVEQ
jgi:hypothetical protein